MPLSHFLPILNFKFFQFKLKTKEIEKKIIEHINYTHYYSLYDINFEKNG